MALPRVHILPRSRRDLRFFSGIVLFTYVTLHLGCHALGLVSLGAAERALDATAAFWQSLPGTALLYGSVLAHVGLAFAAIYERRTLRMPPLQALRIVLGLMMPIALIGHFVGTRYAFERFGIAAEYPRVVGTLWAGGGSGLSLGLLAPGWIHGCLGLRFALSSRRAWQRSRQFLFAFALLLPVLAALGFVTMARVVEAARAAGTLHLDAVTAPQIDHLVGVRDDILLGYGGLFALMALARLVRRYDEHRRRAVVRIRYAGGRGVDVPRGWTVLEASRSHGIPHLSACGGRARCTTCRVRVLEGAEHCPAPAGDERRTLDRIRAPADVRLACQLRPSGDIAVEPMLKVAAGRWQPAPPPPRLVEREAALLAVGLRVASAHAGARLPAHDAFYALDQHRLLVERLCAAAGGVACEAGGGSQGRLAVFGLDASAEVGARLALGVAERIEVEATTLGVRLRRELDAAVACRIVVHVGSVVVGRVGSSESSRHAAVGEGVDALERLLRGESPAGVTLLRTPEALAHAVDPVERPPVVA